MDIVCIYELVFGLCQKVLRKGQTKRMQNVHTHGIVQHVVWIVKQIKLCSIAAEKAITGK